MKAHHARRDRLGDAVMAHDRAQFVESKHRHHARMGARSSEIQGAQAAVRNGAAHERGMQQARDFDVIDKTCATAQQPVIFDPTNRTHGHRVNPACVGAP